nr:MAG TPA: hypothetical protein [Caudoviricetes sp.]
MADPCRFITRSPLRSLNFVRFWQGPDIMVPTASSALAAILLKLRVHYILNS